MALTDDQRALLRLLAQREQGYEDIAALKGLSVDEVRAEVRTALAELDKPPKPPPPPPPPPPEPTPPPPPAAAEPARPAPASDSPPPGGSRPRRPSFSSLPPERRRLLTFAGGGLAVVAAILVAIALLGGSDDSGSSSAAALEGGTELTAAEEEKLTQARLQAPGGGEASGRAIFGRVGQEEVVLQVAAEGLEPNPEGQSYTVWLYRSPKLALRIGSAKVENEDGGLAARFPIPAELLAYVAGGAFGQIYVSETNDAAYEREIAQAEKQERLPSYTGETVLRGKITGPIVEAGAKSGGGGNGGANRGGGGAGGGNGGG